MQNLVKYRIWNFSQKEQLSTVSYFRKKLHLSCLTGFRILLRKYFTKLLGARKGQIH